jgi:hypothetical protein
MQTADRYFQLLLVYGEAIPQYIPGRYLLIVQVTYISFLPVPLY